MIQLSRWNVWVADKAPNGARRASGNWVIPNEVGNELGNNDKEAFYETEAAWHSLTNFRLSAMK